MYQTACCKSSTQLSGSSERMLMAAMCIPGTVGQPSCRIYSRENTQLNDTQQALHINQVTLLCSIGS
jgi:hypothetical protein